MINSRRWGMVVGGCGHWGMMIGYRGNWGIMVGCWGNMMVSRGVVVGGSMMRSMMGMVTMVSMMGVSMITLFPWIKINFGDCNSITGYQWVTKMKHMIRNYKR